MLRVNTPKTQLNASVTVLRCLRCGYDVIVEANLLSQVNCLKCANRLVSLESFKQKN